MKPAAAETILAKITAKDKQVRWFERSGHEMLLDMESADVTAVISEQIRAWTAAVAEKAE